MMFLKVGKIKHKFKLKFTVLKYKYLKTVYLRQKQQERGSHQIEIFSALVKKSIIKFTKTQYMIPMTLFYDEDKNQYLEKQAQVKTYLCDQNGNSIRTIGKTILNIAQYTQRKQKFGLEVQIQGQNKKIKQDVVITFQMLLQRQDDDSKSVNSMSQDQMQFKSSQLNQVKSKQRNSKSKDKRNFLYPIAQSTVSTKSAQDKLKQSTISDMDQKFSQKTKKYNKKDNSPIKYLQDPKKDKNKHDEQSQNDNFFSRMQKKQQKTKRDVSIKRDSVKSKQTLNKKVTKQKQQIKINTYVQDEQTKNSSVELRLHLASSKINSIQKQNSQLRNESVRLKRIIEDLIQQKSQKQINESTSSNQIQQQAQYYKKIIIQKQMKINELQGLNKLVLQRQDKKQKQIKQLRNENKDLMMKLQHQKNKLAKVLQTAMQSQNVQLLQIIQKQIDDQYY